MEDKKIHTCEEFVLNELDKSNKELAELKSIDNKLLKDNNFLIHFLKYLQRRCVFIKDNSTGDPLNKRETIYFKIEKDLKNENEKEQSDFNFTKQIFVLKYTIEELLEELR